VIDMANEIHADYASGNIVYAVIRNAEAGVWCAAKQAFESWGAGGHTACDYASPLTDKGGSRYIGDFDAGIPLGQYRIQLFVQVGASPADGDTILASRDIAWTGTGELTALKILANKAIQNTTTSAVDYYDDDNETIVLRHNWHEDPSGSMRTIG
jgi:hypothetical protein